MADAPELSRITTLTQLDDLLNLSLDRLVWLFKHSLVCGTSAGAWSEFERFAARQPQGTAMGVIEIQHARDVSREVEARTGVRHESPQVLLIRGGQPVWYASHWGITEQVLDEAAKAHVAPESASC